MEENKDSRPVKEDEDFLDVLGNQQLTKKIIKQGLENTRPERSFICVINYTEKLDGTIIEDKQNFVLQVGDVEVCQGVDMVIPLMNVGEIAEINVDSRFAYGELGLKGTDGTIIVPPNAKVVYTVELISAKEESELETKSFSARKEIGNKKRERGNWWFERGEFNLAIQSYRRALEYLDETEGGIVFDPEPSTDELQDLLEDRIKVYNNLAQAQMKISAYDTALKSIDHVLLCRPDNIKALFRKGKILEAKGDTNEAIKFLQKAATLDYNNKVIQNELSKLILKSKREARNEKNMYQKMLGKMGTQKWENKNKKVVTSSKEANNKTLKLCGYLIGSILVGVTGMAIWRYNAMKV